MDIHKYRIAWIEENGDIPYRYAPTQLIAIEAMNEELRRRKTRVLYYHIFEKSSKGFKLIYSESMS